ncbi:hypothetical protein CEB3_c30120 [Peptococcaceae bacterium CEB3]|nr:hypothetical protein CEB3_c30120 [Peptococcaceae bacterium CEB3]
MPEKVVIPDLPNVDVQHCCRAMDFLLEPQEDVEREVFHAVADLFHLEVDLLFFDTTSTYFEMDKWDEEEEDLKALGRSKDSRRDLPQIVIGLAVTRDGIPIRSWVWLGNTSDMSVIPEVKRDLAGWKLGGVVSVIDRGFSSKEDLRILQRTGGHYIAGERLTAGKPEVEEALPPRIPKGFVRFRKTWRRKKWLSAMERPASAMFWSVTLRKPSVMPTPAPSTWKS